MPFHPPRAGREGRMNRIEGHPARQAVETKRRRWYEAAAGAGFIFLRLPRGRNSPPPKGWNKSWPPKETQDASRDPDVALSRLRSNDNVGVGCGEGCCLVDPDTAQAVAAVEALLDGPCLSMLDPARSAVPLPRRACRRPRAGPKRSRHPGLRHPRGDGGLWHGAGEYAPRGFLQGQAGHTRRGAALGLRARGGLRRGCRHSASAGRCPVCAHCARYAACR